MFFQYTTDETDVTEVHNEEYLLFGYTILFSTIRVDV